MSNIENKFKIGTKQIILVNIQILRKFASEFNDMFVLVYITAVLFHFENCLARQTTRFKVQIQIQQKSIF